MAAWSIAQSWSVTFGPLLQSLADKVDALATSFSLGHRPSGSRDPFALRRAAQGVVKILVEGKIEILLLSLIQGDDALVAFMEDRVRFYFKDVRGFRYDEVNACMAASVSISSKSRMTRFHMDSPLELE